MAFNSYFTFDTLVQFIVGTGVDIAYLFYQKVVAELFHNLLPDVSKRQK